jgi:hypothetical protein
MRAIGFREFLPRSFLFLVVLQKYYDHDYLQRDGEY